MRPGDAGGLTPAERTRLVGILGRLGSDFDGERAAAGLLANRMLQARGLTWADLLAAREAQQGGRSEAQQARADLELCGRHLERLDGWPAVFASSLMRRRSPMTPAQRAKLAQIADHLRARGLT